LATNTIRLKFGRTRLRIQTVEALQERNIDIDEAHSTDWRAVGITNQRETTIAWNRLNGQPYYNAIVWDDTRTTNIASQIADGDMDRLRTKTAGLPVASHSLRYTKIKWLPDNVP
jgi:glycerol kinase